MFKYLNTVNDLLMAIYRNQPDYIIAAAESIIETAKMQKLHNSKISNAECEYTEELSDDLDAYLDTDSFEENDWLG